MASVKGTETEKNLLKSFAGESQAKNRYTFFAKVAKKEGYEQISALFLETALNEEQHAKRMFEWLEGGDLEITACYPAGRIGTTKENLKASAMGENEEYTKLYPEFAAVADKEGFKEIALFYRNLAKVENEHEKRFLKLLENVEKEEVFKKQEKDKWICMKCGFIYEGFEAPKMCPVCQHPQAYFMLDPENY
ncbi:rubrerythrin family protein [Myxococcota bacterium]|nr:rubrerythrin family protein [Myxococcota bacterium]MBU1383214.1 rubrerythrin family protein [Myxococcota bacterium]MBU1499166.1 rubrerythrin family protein [Myxococcota bacterium]